MAGNSAHGSVEPFVLEGADGDDWVEWTEILEQHFNSYEIEDNEDNKGRRRAIFLSNVGKSTYKLIKKLVAPAKIDTKSLDELIAAVTKHLQPKPSTIVARYHFNTAVRSSDQSVSVFIAQLKLLVSKCEYSTIEFANEMLRDRLVAGVQDDKILTRLLAEPDTLTFARAMDLAVSMEAAVANTKKIMQVPSNVNMVTTPSFVERRACFCCGVKGHLKQDCVHKDQACARCGRKGHVAQICGNRSQEMPVRRNIPQGRKSQPVPGPKQAPYKGGYNGNKKVNTQYVAEEEEVEGSVYYYSEYEEELFTIGGRGALGRKDPPIEVEVVMDGREVKMEVDTGARKSIMSQAAYETIWPLRRPELHATPSVLKTYTGEIIKPVGEIKVDVEHHGQKKVLPLIIAPGEGVTLLGRNWLREINLDWRGIQQNLMPVYKVQQEEFADVFNGGLGTLNGVTVSLTVKKDAIPKFCKARSLPFAMKGKVETELDRLQKDGIISPVNTAKWASPIVPVLKDDGCVRICGDYKVSINPELVVDCYPLPTPEDLFATLAGCVIYTKLDMSHAYQQLLLDEDSKQYLTINTHKGLFTFNRLTFGVASAPAVFQRTIESILKGITGVAVYLDDILIGGKSEKEHDEAVREVLSRLAKAGLRLKKQKCTIGVPVVEYIGHRISAEGIMPLEDKVEAIVQAPVPTNVTELQSLLGMIVYYDKFLPNLSDTLEPLHKLLRKGAVWEWSSAQNKAFEAVKMMLKSAPVLCHYDTSRPLRLTVDSSSYGLGAVLSHVTEDESDQPIAYKSRKLSQAERNYSQLDKEALAVLFGVKKFHKYVYGRKFEIVTDHKPLLGLLGETKAIPVMSSPRLQRWAITLSGYEYHLSYHPGKDIANADALSRLPLPDMPADGEVPVPGEAIRVMEVLDSTPVTSQHVREWTRRDPVLGKILVHLLDQSQEISGPEFEPYQKRMDELSLEDGLVMWGCRVIIPPKGRKQLLNELHQGHPGVARMKALARGYIWWPKMDAEIEEEVKSCMSCQENQQMPGEAPLHPWEYPDKPWSRVHLDYAGPFLGKMYLVMVDSYSKWIEVHIVNAATSEATIEKCRMTFAIHGIPDILVTDNGAVFTSQEFEEYMRMNGVKVVHSAPYHPRTNGLAENAVKTFKAGLKKMGNGGSLQGRLSKFLFNYRITPHTVTGRSPAELLLGRRPRSRLSMILPGAKDRVMKKQWKQSLDHDKQSVDRVVKCGDTVHVRNYAPGALWLPGRVEIQTGPVSFLVKLGDGRLVRRHQDQLRLRHRECSLSLPKDTETLEYRTPEPQIEAPIEAAQPDAVTSAPVQTEAPQPMSPVVALRRSARGNKGIPPERLDM